MEIASRARSGTVVHRPTVQEESANERETLLMRLGQALGRTAVPAAFWACIRVADLSALERLVAQAQAAPDICILLFENCYALPRLWMQRNSNDKDSTSTTTASSASSNRSSSHESRGVARSKSEEEKAVVRDRETCVITKTPPIQICHIYPRSLLSENRTGVLQAAVPPFWSLLRLFFDKDKIDQWHSEIFRNPNQPDKGVETCENLMCLTPQLHTYWGMGKCAFRPVWKSDTELELEYHWLPKPPHGHRDNILLSQQPQSTQGLRDSGGSILTTSDFTPLCSGQRFTLQTEDPENLPLPSFALLDMQWKLNQMVSLSAAGEAPDLEEDRDDGDVSPVPAFDRGSIENWALESSHGGDVTEYSENTHLTASAFPTPESPR